MPTVLFTNTSRRVGFPARSILSVVSNSPERTSTVMVFTGCYEHSSIAETLQRYRTHYCSLSTRYITSRRSLCHLLQLQSVILANTRVAVLPRIDVLAFIAALNDQLLFRCRVGSRTCSVYNNPREFHASLTLVSWPLTPAHRLAPVPNTRYSKRFGLCCTFILLAGSLCHDLCGKEFP